MTKPNSTSPLSQISRQDIRDLAESDRYLIISIFAGVLIAFLGVTLASAANSYGIFILTIVLRSLAGLASAFFFYHLMRLSKLGNPIVMTIVFLVFALIKGLSFIGWLMVAYYISQVHSQILKPNGYKIGFFGPEIKK